MKLPVYREMAEIEDTNWFFLGKRMFVSAVIHTLSLPKSPKLLDIGCGTGGMTSMLAQFGSVTGIEQNSYAVSQSRARGLTVRKASANRLPFPRNRFDAVTFFDVLYHARIIESNALSEAYRVLKKNGILIVTDCAHQACWTKHDEMVEARLRYSKTELKNAVTKAGFRIKRVSYMYMFTFPLFLLQRLTTIITNHYIPLSSIPQGINTLLLLTVRLESILLADIDLPFGSSILVVAVK